MAHQHHHHHPSDDAFSDLQRTRQLARERQAARTLINAYGQVWEDIDARLSHLARQIAEARAAGAEVRVSWLYQANRLQQLEQQVQETVARFGDSAQRLTEQMMRQGAEHGASDALAAMQAMIEHQLGEAGLQDLNPLIVSSFNRLNMAALNNAANNAFTYGEKAKASGNRRRRIADLYKSMPSDMAKRAKRTIVYAVATGQSPSVTARQLRQQLGIALNLALTIARTEQMNAYRRSAIATFRANSDVCDGWRWLAAGDACPFCASMNGSVHTLDEELDSHPNCRCTAQPIAKPLSEILDSFGLAA